MHPRQILDRYGITPKQSLGQNFLYDEGLLGRIVAAAELSPGDAVLEVGPGLGALTRQLAQVAGRVVAVELDDRLLPVLRYELSPFSHVAIVHADILSFDPAAWFDAPFVVVANVPYYITGAILRHLLEGRPRPRRLVLTVQREVAERLAATPPKMSLLAVSVQYYGSVKVAGAVKAGAFWPRPEVDSAVIRVDVEERFLSREAGEQESRGNEEAFFRVVRAGFSQKRKQLKNNLRRLGLSDEVIAAALGEAGIDGRRRAETLTVEEWEQLTQRLENKV
ncbi:MAG: 16S rRNA (adenine(1518)-N(6)/adenine(1519)-N(6))-dimethyltransferase RsmA [Anaerolineae bacterium]|uniref:16S rRNA (adenine(1518)-N(6)/adenine(1519)-N(6))- dimethyltransferase RsmA n=1 Tax=Promineifilum sp. TaxID=2664178 RepID=UPI001E02CED6|nr:16S rRNA (adenine(1518)-N(6)/adenine(1519)-N(6))-dimethyltransferase RsmA [Anaerolineales bacterium]MCB8934497.1 16S rRNA (adenine(1518)-N(6)/adenine(1519)-N(6))-dimethyltransferase RsmA [Promineifilum sp.]MCO5179933.1 16S rRNA (adenine(1518)-N(6)/adenine(1519)-N(6))-dimethyltransferase RsmA [Promineifilum sp.]MCW5847093.1 16S rRNA (adenine(1518)-N(6)/adenine(1519)-N(6))-dimethyltransferase RsmA [Anaerolineae bacterium]